MNPPKRPYWQQAPTLGGTYFFTPWHPEFIDWLKANVPREERDYDPDDKSWYVSPIFAERVKGKAQSFWPGIKEHRPFDSGRYEREQQRQQYQPPPGPQASSDHAALFVTASAPKVVIVAAYKALARLYHPDSGGDTAAMQRVNAAYESLKKAGKA